MELKSRVTVCALLLMLLVLSHDENNGVAEARVCTGKSDHHSFPCISDRVCSNTCVKEGTGWTAGYCHRRFCTCQKAC
ncbi:hypothetical protein QOZ80_8BG0649710 [Eleusine coracana subsp. coracana]|nr:hypothetical protein QOZ80_8BG0649710 [Eleusine coracana subsp. coracana]